MRLKEVREQKGITQLELSKALNISPSAVGMYEQGRREPDFDTLKKIADYFHVSIDYLLGHKTTPDDMKSILFQTPNGKASPERLAIMEMIPHIPNNKLPMARSLMEVLTKEDYDNMA